MNFRMEQTSHKQEHWNVVYFIICMYCLAVKTTLPSLLNLKIQQTNKVSSLPEDCCHCLGGWETGGSGSSTAGLKYIHQPQGILSHGNHEPYWIYGSGSQECILNYKKMVAGNQDNIETMSSLSKIRIMMQY